MTSDDSKAYKELINSKRRRVIESYIDADDKDLSSILFPFQRHVVKKALKAGRYAIFADCGLGKTFMQLSWANVVSKHTNKPVLILAPLGVKKQTKLEGEKLGIQVVDAHSDGLPFTQNQHITNYEQLDNIDLSLYGGVVLDESSILKNFEGKMRNKLIDAFEDYDYKLCCTATPSPNDVMELGNHAEFLGIMKRQEVLAMYFVHDGGQTSKWRLKGHAKSGFWAFVSSWASMFSKPSDIGFCDEGYDLPPLNIMERMIITDKRDNGMLFNDTAVSATEFNKELRLTLVERVEDVADLVNSTSDPFLVWVKQNEEGKRLGKLITDSVEVKGSDKPETKEKNLLGFADGDFRVLITKAKIAKFGLNYQHCNNMVFCSFDFSFEALYQAIRRCLRFGQEKEVNVYLITTDTMQNVASAIKRKEEQFIETRNEMNKQINQVNQMNTELDDKSFKVDGHELMLGDCVQRIQELEDESVGFSVFSPPFAELYTYSDKPDDMGNSKDYKEFLSQFSFLVKELYRVLESGRNVAVHCMDLPIQKGKEGFIGLRDFSGMILKAFSDEGFIYHSRITIWKNPVTEMQRTKALGLLHKQVKKDSTMSRVGIPDYVLIFRKDGERENPVTNKDIPVDLWQKYASPVWMDIDYSNTLNYRSGRTEQDEKHICPLQLPTIERLIHLYTNKGDVVFSPFAGIGSEMYQAIKMDRIAKGIELKESYFNLAIKHMNSALQTNKQSQLF